MVMSLAMRCELLGHAVPAREHRGFSDFEYATHVNTLKPDVKTPACGGGVRCCL